jgi:aldose 1-epimerase
MTGIVEITDSGRGAVARVAVDRGFNCCSFAVDGHELLDSVPGFAQGEGRPSGHGIPILFPFPNRIRDGRFSWNGRSYQLPPPIAPDDGNGNAIHGFCLDRPWRVISQDTSSVTGEFQLSRDAADRRPLWPSDARIRVAYRLEDNRLLADVTIDNPDMEDLPFGFGTHPYFRLPLGSGGTALDCRVHVPAHRQWELDACLPTGRLLPLDASCDLRHGGRFGDMQLDHVLTSIADINHQPLAVLEMSVGDPGARRRLTQRCDGGVFREIVVYTPPGRDAVCLEPYTCVTDAINLDPAGTTSGWQVLAAGQKWETRIELFTGPLEVDRLLD